MCNPDNYSFSLISGQSQYPANVFIGVRVISGEPAETIYSPCYALGAAGRRKKAFQIGKTCKPVSLRPID